MGVLGGALLLSLKLSRAAVNLALVRLEVAEVAALLHALLAGLLAALLLLLDAGLGRLHLPDDVLLERVEVGNAGVLLQLRAAVQALLAAHLAVVLAHFPRNFVLRREREREERARGKVSGKRQSERGWIV